MKIAGWTKAMADIPGVERMSTAFKVGGHVWSNSEAGRVSGVIIKKLTSNIRFKGYTLSCIESGTTVHDQER